MNARVFIGVVEGTYGCLFKHLCGGMMEKHGGKLECGMVPTAKCFGDGSLWL